MFLVLIRSASKEYPQHILLWRNKRNIYGYPHLFGVIFDMKTLCCGYSLEVPQRGASNEYPRHMFSYRNKKNDMGYPLLSVMLHDSYMCVAEWMQMW